MSTAADRGSRSSSYHHGALRESLLAAAEKLLEEGGIPALTLRAVARAAGVSHAAPAHHFGDLTGLLSELAAVGFIRLAAAFEAAMEAAGDEPNARLTAMGEAYVGFARACPSLFSLMFRSERLDQSRPALRDATAAAGQALRAAIAQAQPSEGGAEAVQTIARATALWSLVHGFSVLLIDNRLGGLLGALPPGNDADTLLGAMLDAISIDDRGGMNSALRAE
ncbi:MAG: TetR/AcrR family transcriptional regulator [Alphaproteobacteria bacterium]|nr:TetR/AcrR family transcriptional regulator [Alphaproteobacteria bacterium]